MYNFPETEAIELELNAAGLLPVLYCHGCCDDSHRCHAELAIIFNEHGLLLQCDPFEGGDNVQVAMRSFLFHGVIFHADTKSVASLACATELKTAKELGAPIFTLCDGISTPAEQRDRISIRLTARGIITPTCAESLASQMLKRARIHWVYSWLAESRRTIDEREAGAAWLCQQPGPVLAEFLPAIVSLHRGVDEDPTFSARIATVLERTNLRSEVKLHLLRWHGEVTHPLSRMAIEDILGEWGWKVNASQENPNIPPE
jgi:hypothetical protein